MVLRVDTAIYKQTCHSHAAVTRVRCLLISASALCIWIVITSSCVHVILHDDKTTLWVFI